MQTYADISREKFGYISVKANGARLVSAVFLPNIKGFFVYLAPTK